ncbi:MAG TPA: ComEC/Rec2 family competence protein, partial [Rubrivivax sp.]|nr:ComEC/Rec2 family competence protein [Rubrivivax sp.]
MTGWRWSAAALAWLAGVGLQLRQPELWSIGVYVSAGAVGIGLLWFATRRVPMTASGGVERADAGTARADPGTTDAPVARSAPAVGRTPFTGVQWSTVARLAPLLLACALLGHALAGWHGAARWAQSLPADLEGVDLQVTGLVSGLPRQRGQGTQFLFNVETATSPGRGPVVLPPTLSLGWYPGWGHDAVMTPLQRELRAGQRWRFTVRLRQPHGLSNPHGFDHELHLFERGVRATGQVREGTAELLHRRAGHPVERLRQRVRDGIDATVPEPGPAGVLAGLAIGDQAAIEREDWDLFRITGITHLVAISGLHVTMFAWMAAGLIRPAWRRCTPAMLWV